jgi:uncharacterized protein involved in exopolysaccharide biosynthesis
VSTVEGNGYHVPGWHNRAWLVRTGLIVLSAALATAVVSFLWPKTYRAEAKILPNVSNSGSSPLLGLASASGLGDLLSSQLGSLENPILTYPEILRSRTMRERVAQAPYTPSERPPTTIMAALEIRPPNRIGLEKAVRVLGDLTQVEANPRSGVISVSAVCRDSVLAAFVVGAMLVELDRFNVEARSSRERATREFVEARLQEARRELASAESGLTRFREGNIRMGNSPQLQLEQSRLEREVSTRAEIVSLLARQYELARIEEKRDTPTFTVVDPPRPPVRKYRPMIVVNILVVSFGVFGARVLTERIASQRATTARFAPEHITSFETGRGLPVS